MSKKLEQLKVSTMCALPKSSCSAAWLKLDAEASGYHLLTNKTTASLLNESSTNTEPSSHPIQLTPELSGICLQIFHISFSLKCGKLSVTHGMQKYLWHHYPNKQINCLTVAANPVAKDNSEFLFILRSKPTPKPVPVTHLLVYRTSYRTGLGVGFSPWYVSDTHPPMQLTLGGRGRWGWSSLQIKVLS